MGMGTVQLLTMGHPWWLAALAVLPVLLYYWRRSLVHFPRRRRLISLAVRIVLVALLVLVLCGVTWTYRSAQQFVVLAVDQSRSVAGDSGKIAKTFGEEAAGQQDHPRTVYLPFAAAPGEIATELADSPGSAASAAGDAATNLAAAIRAARAAIPADYVPQIVLFSDGNQTDEDALSAARAAGVPVSTVPLPTVEPEVYIAGVDAPTRVREGQPFTVGVTVQSTHDGDGVVEIHERGARPVIHQRQHVHKGENHWRFPLLAPAGPVAAYSVRLSEFPDTLAENNTASFGVLVGPKPRVLLVESKPVLAAHLADALKEQNIEVQVCLPAAIPDTASGLERYDLVILSNVPAAALPAARMELLRGYVRDYGGGLIAVGGDQAFTPGGYHGTPLEEILPVWSEAKKNKPKPTLAMVVVLDCSGSMEGKSITLAKQAMQRAVEMLSPRDQIGLLAFEDRSWWVSPLHVCNDKAQILQRLDTIAAGGETDMYPPLEKAYLALRDSFADLKHMIVLTDGVSSPGDFEALVKRIAASGITVSTLAVGDEAAGPLLQDMAERARGHYYFCDDVAKVPQIFELETSIAAKLGITEEPFSPKMVHPAAMLGTLDFKGAPTLLGYVETRPKDGSQLVLASESGDPLLVYWQYGRGTSVAFTSDIQSRWAAAWLQWPDFGPFWVGLVRDALRKEPPLPSTLHVEQDGRGVLAILDAQDAQGHFFNGGEVALRVIDPPQKARELSLPQVAPGRYAARFATSTAGLYLLEPKLTYQGRPIDVERRVIGATYPDELRVKPVNTGLLQEIAQVSGGRFDPKPAELLAPADRSVPRTLPLWPYLLAAALLLFLLDLSLKRLEPPQTPLARTRERGNR